MGSTRRSDMFHGVTVFVLLCALVLCAPGLALVHGVDQLLGLRLDRGQLWAFGASASVVMMVAGAKLSAGWLIGLSRYVVASLGTLGALLVAHYGFHAAFTRQMWAAIWP